MNNISIEDTGSIAAHKIDGIAGAAIAAVATGGLSLLATDFSFLSNKKPVYQDFGAKIEDRRTKESRRVGITGAIKADASNAKVTRAFFDIMADEWLKVHVRKEASTSNAASAVPATQSSASAVPETQSAASAVSTAQPMAETPADTTEL